MSRRSIGLDDAVQNYLLTATLREPEVARELREETARLDNADMQISPEQGQFMTLLCELLGARRALEVGTFTGYSAMCVARALPPDGKLICCDKSEEWTSIARRYWAQAGLADRIELRLGPGQETLNALLAEGQAGKFDFAFIDADKEGYDQYYESCLKLVRCGGLLGFDNALSNGRVVSPEHADRASAKHIDALNRKIQQDERVSMLSLVPIGDGLLLARKR